MRLAWGAKVSPEFGAKTVAMCGRLGIADPNWMMGGMAFETGRSFRADVVNHLSGATGLIQFMPSTARSLGTTVEDLAKLTPEQQLDWVEKYFRPYIGKLNSLDDVYMAILWPAAVGKLLTFVLFSADDANSKAYVQNKGLDVDADGKITKGEATAYVQKALNEGLQAGNVSDIGEGSIAPEDVKIGDYDPHNQAGQDPIPPVREETTAGSTSEHQMPAILATLLPTILSMFTPLAAAKLGKVTGLPPEQQNLFLQQLFGQVAQMTQVGTPNPNTGALELKTDQQAIQATTAMLALKDQNSELVKKLEAHALDFLDQLGPVFDRLADRDDANNAATLALRASASVAQGANPKLVKLVVKNITDSTWALVGGVLVATIVAIVAKARWPAMPDYAAMLIPTLALLAGQVMKERGAVVSHFFDGTPSSNASAALNAAAVAALPEKQGTAIVGEYLPKKP